jgi:hypothetical protein
VHEEAKKGGVDQQGGSRRWRARDDSKPTGGLKCDGEAVNGMTWLSCTNASTAAARPMFPKRDCWGAGPYMLLM